MILHAVAKAEVKSPKATTAFCNNPCKGNKEHDATEILFKRCILVKVVLSIGNKRAFIISGNKLILFPEELSLWEGIITLFAVDIKMDFCYFIQSCLFDCIEMIMTS